MQWRTRGWSSTATTAPWGSQVGPTYSPTGSRRTAPAEVAEASSTAMTAPMPLSKNATSPPIGETSTDRDCRENCAMTVAVRLVIFSFTGKRCIRVGSERRRKWPVTYATIFQAMFGIFSHNCARFTNSGPRNTSAKKWWKVVRSGKSALQCCNQPCNV